MITIIRQGHKLKINSFTLVELLVVIAIIGMLAGITVPTVGKALEKGKIAADLGKSRTWKEIDLLVVNEGDPTISQYPGSSAESLPLWYAGILRVVGTNAALKLFSVAEIKPTNFSSQTGPNTNPYVIYATSEDTNVSVMLTTRNWRLPTTGSGPALSKGVKPFGDLGATMFLNNGSAFLITPQLATNALTNWGTVGTPLN